MTVSQKVYPLRDGTFRPAFFACKFMQVCYNRNVFVYKIFTLNL